MEVLFIYLFLVTLPFTYFGVVIFNAYVFTKRLDKYKKEKGIAIYKD